MALFTLAEARAELDRLRPALAEIVTCRADAAELAAVLAGGPASPLGGLPEWKAAAARLDDLMTEVQQTGADLRSLAPLLVDFPGELADGTPVLLCWLEGEPELTWYHRVDLGYAGRRRLP